MAASAGRSIATGGIVRAAGARREVRPQQLFTSAATWLFILAGLAFMVLPGFWMVLSSFKTRAEIVAVPLTLLPTVFRLDNYLQAINAMNFWRVFANSLVVTSSVTVANIFTSTWGGYTFGKLRWPGRDRVFMVLLSTLMIPGFLSLIPRYVLTSKLHMLNNYEGMIVPFLVGAFGIFLTKQFMLGIPDELLDAARVDGASALGIYWKIVLPLSTSVMAVLAIFTFDWSWDDLLWGSIVLTDRTMWTLPVAIAGLRMQTGNLVELQMAGSTLAVIPVVIIFIALQRHIIQGVALSGVKG